MRHMLSQSTPRFEMQCFPVQSMLLMWGEVEWCGLVWLCMLNAWMCEGVSQEYIIHHNNSRYHVGITYACMNTFVGIKYICKYTHK